MLFCFESVLQRDARLTIQEFEGGSKAKRARTEPTAAAGVPPADAPDLAGACDAAMAGVDDAEKAVRLKAAVDKVEAETARILEHGVSRASS